MRTKLLNKFTSFNWEDYEEDILHILHLAEDNDIKIENYPVDYGILISLSAYPLDLNIVVEICERLDTVIKVRKVDVYGYQENTRLMKFLKRPSRSAQKSYKQDFDSMLNDFESTHRAEIHIEHHFYKELQVVFDEILKN